MINVINNKCNPYIEGGSNIYCSLGTESKLHALNTNLTLPWQCWRYPAEVFPYTFEMTGRMGHKSIKYILHPPHFVRLPLASSWPVYTHPGLKRDLNPSLPFRQTALKYYSPWASPVFLFSW